ncbi:MAG: metallophosphoesterase [Myxococcota bacterium]
MLLAALLAAGCSDSRVPVGVAPAPALASPDRVRFVALGDAGKGNKGQARVAAGVAKACAERGCDLVVLLGDNLYPRGMEADDDPHADERIAQMYAPVGAPVYLVLGNHDYAHGRSRAAAARQIAWAGRTPGVELPANAWVGDFGPARVVGLDTNAVFQFGEDFQARWLREQLDASDAPWKVVLGHHPFRSDGPHGNAGRYDGTRWVPWVSGSALRTLFDGSLCGADLYLAGHDHTRQLLEACGTDLVVSGTGASATEIVDNGNHPRFAEATLGAAWFELSADGSGRVVFLDADGAEEAGFELHAGG